MSDLGIDYLIGNHEQIDVPSIHKHLKSASHKLRNIPLQTIIDILDSFGRRLLEKNNPIHRKFPSHGIPYIAGWCRRNVLEKLMINSIGNPEIIDHFIPAKNHTKRDYLLLPRGMVVHWMAGNVPTLGFLSLLQGLLTKNCNIVKTPSSSSQLLAELLVNLEETAQNQTYTGADLASSVAVLRYDRKHRHINEQISLLADTRIFWGNNDSIEVLRTLKSKLGVIDIVFSNKVSMMVVDKETLSSADWLTLSKKIATDISVFEQKACASPHTLFIESTDEKDVEKVATYLQKAMDKALKSFPKSSMGGQERSAILNLRAQYDMYHQAWYPQGLEYTILSDNQLQLGPAIGNRTLFIRQVADLKQIGDLIDDHVQTVGLAVCKERYEEVTLYLAKCGIQRFTEIGAMTHFEVPWDGYQLAHHLVRWVSRPLRIDNKS
jgi:hypothetical protein